MPDLGEDQAALGMDCACDFLPGLDLGIGEDASDSGIASCLEAVSWVTLPLPLAKP